MMRPRKTGLNRETLRRLGAAALGRVGGGYRHTGGATCGRLTADACSNSTDPDQCTSDPRDTSYDGGCSYAPGVC